MKISDLIGSQVLSLAGARICGVVCGARFSEKLTRLKAVEVFMSDDGDCERKYLDVRRMDAHGGWIASAEDMARFMMRIDRNTAVGDILPDSLAAQFYLGFEQWIHTGSLPGTAAVLMRIDDRLSFVLLADKRSYDTNFWEELSHETAAAIALDDKRQREHAH